MNNHLRDPCRWLLVNGVAGVWSHESGGKSVNVDETLQNFYALFFVFSTYCVIFTCLIQACHQEKTV